MSPAMPSSRRRRSASTSRPSRIRSPALSCSTRSSTLSHSGVAYSGWLPTSRYSRAPFLRNTLLLRPHDTTRRKRYRATSSGDSRRCPRKVQVTPYSFSSPKIRRSTRQGYVPSCRDDSTEGPCHPAARSLPSAAAHLRQQVPVPDVDRVRAVMVDTRRLAQSGQGSRLGLPVVEEPGRAVGDEERRPLRSRVVPGALGLPHVRLQ